MDEATKLIGMHTSSLPDLKYPEKWYQGYFFPLMVAYSFGLFLAFFAFCLMEIGQPALLYINPCLLGTLAVLGRKNLKDLWDGPEVMQLADKLKRKCEKSWGRQRMRRQVEKQKMERGDQPQVYERQIFSNKDKKKMMTR